MKANELRIGNWVNLCFHHKPGWFPARVTAIHPENRIDTDTKDNEGNREYYFEGVPLSPEILEACGFEEDKEDAQIYNYKSVYLYYSLKANSFNLWRDDDSISIAICLCNNIKYLHQLQNFIFIYTGSELTVNLEKVKYDKQI